MKTTGLSQAKIARELTKEYIAKKAYCNDMFTKVDVLAIVSAFDDSAMVLQEMGKQDFLECIGYDFLPSNGVLMTVRCVLWLFNIDTSKTSDSIVWSGIWAAWIVKNIDAHVLGWEWMTCNEPLGLFTKPYDLSSKYLDEIEIILPEIAATAQQTWQPAYALLRNWVCCAFDYLHMATNVLPINPLAKYIATLLEPSKRTPKENIWFVAHTEDDVPFYYNRHSQECVLDEPEDFDGARVLVPRFMELQMLDVLMGDANLRAEVEVRRHLLEMARDKDNAWVECYDYITKARYYYSLQRLKLSYSRPNSRNIIKAETSPAYRSVIRIQSAYRRRQAQELVNEKRAKCKQMPRFQTRHFF
ncbi:hypothetical protein THRCLA_07776 [Thraustotheca clavata]|uniref:Uncharacterized protein n=1 Tax=Thraustotheca clavata TaxID=74557 RepID=A0A1V9ZC33_9STRA|nr:hypothetical protein THRCLA_07776 [Thraustotheca clavata]